MLDCMKTSQKNMRYYSRDYFCPSMYIATIARFRLALLIVRCCIITKFKNKNIFFQAGSGTNCVDIDECTIQNGGCDDICMNSPGWKIKQ